MSAYVKFLDGPDMGRKMIVSLSKFKNKIANKNFNTTKKYYVQCRDDQYHKAQVLFIEGNKEDLEQKIKNDRSRCKSLKKLETETEDEESSPHKLNKSKSMMAKSSTTSTANKEMKLKKYASILGMKTNKLLPLLQSDDSSKEVLESTENEKTQDENEIENVTSKLHNEMPQKDTENIKKGDKTLKLRDKTTKQEDAKRNTEANKTMKIRVLSNEEVHIPEVCQAQMQKQVAEIGELKKINAQLKKENDKLKHKHSKLKKEIEMEKVKSKNFEDLNMKIQQSVIDMFEEKQVVKQQLENAREDIFMDHGKNFVPVGQIRESDHTVHIGRGERLSVKDYNSVMAAKSPQQCVGNAILQVFTEPVLLKSTITGNVSNKTIGKKNKNKTKEGEKENEIKKQKVEKLDEVKLLACQDLFIHWLKTQYSLKVESFDLYGEVANFNSYVSKKISYLKRPATTSKKSTKVQLDEDDQSDENLETNPLSEDKNIVAEAQIHEAAKDSTKTVEAQSKESKNKLLNRNEPDVDIDQIEFVSTDILNNSKSDAISDVCSDISENVPSISDNDDTDPLDID